MNKIFLIIKREYLSRVTNKSFIIMTILGPILMAALMIVPAWIGINNNEVRRIAVLDDYHSPFCDGLFYKEFKDTEYIKYDYITDNLEHAKKNLKANGYYAVLHLPKFSGFSKDKNDKIRFNVEMFGNEKISINVKVHTENELEKVINKIRTNNDLEQKLVSLGIDSSMLQGKSMKEVSENIANTIKESSNSTININTVKINADSGIEEDGNSEVISGLAWISGLLIYMFIFLFGAQVMRGVIEEKTSRIVEVVISSVKPFQLMMGKITGIALVGLTQFLLWIILTFSIISIVQIAFPGKLEFNKTEQVLTRSDGASVIPTEAAPKEQINEILVQIGSIDFPLIIGMFIFYFLCGYLFYAALFAAIGSAVDNDTDTQQFMLPISIPLVLGIALTPAIINNPQGSLAFWMSIIPFTSPIAMMVRIPFGVPFIDLVLSIILLLSGIFLNTWFAAKIYRTGILMYGKKVSYKELWKWIRY